MLRHIVLVGTDVSKELTRTTLSNIPEDGILHSEKPQILSPV
jgi:hypothetical protein